MHSIPTERRDVGKPSPHLHWVSRCATQRNTWSAPRFDTDLVCQGLDLSGPLVSNRATRCARRYGGFTTTSAAHRPHRPILDEMRRPPLQASATGAGRGHRGGDRNPCDCGLPLPGACGLGTCGRNPGPAAHRLRPGPPGRGIPRTAEVYTAEFTGSIQYRPPISEDLVAEFSYVFDSSPPRLDGPA